MDHAAGLLRVLFPDHVQSVLHRVPGVNDDGKPHFLRQGDLPPEPVLLHLPVRLLVVVLEADLPDGSDLRMRGELRKPPEHIFRQVLLLRVPPDGTRGTCPPGGIILSSGRPAFLALRFLVEHRRRSREDVVRVHAHGTVNMGPFLRHLKAAERTPYRGACVDHFLNALLREAPQKDLPVMIKLFIVIMGVCINDSVHDVLFLNSCCFVLNSDCTTGQKFSF